MMGPKDLRYKSLRTQIQLAALAKDDEKVSSNGSLCYYYSNSTFGIIIKCPATQETDKSRPPHYEITLLNKYAYDMRLKG